MKLMIYIYISYYNRLYGFIWLYMAIDAIGNNQPSKQEVGERPNKNRFGHLPNVNSRGTGRVYIFTIFTHSQQSACNKHQHEVF